MGEFNRDVDTALNASRLSRIRLSSAVIAEIESVQEARRAKVRAQSNLDGGGAAGAGEPGECTSPLAGAPVTRVDLDDYDARDAGSGGGDGSDGGGGSLMLVTVGSDIAFAMEEGSGSSSRMHWWVARVCKLLKGKARYEGSVSLDDELPKDMVAVCEWYSRIPKTNSLKFRFRKDTDRARYSFVNCTGIVRIDLAGSSSSSASEDVYTITTEVRAMLDEGLKMTTPVKPGSKTTEGERKQKAAKQAEEAAEYRSGLQQPSLSLARSGARGGTRGASMED